MLYGLSIDDIACLQAIEQSELATLKNQDKYSIYLGIKNSPDIEATAYFLTFQFDIFTWASARHKAYLDCPLTIREAGFSYSGIQQRVLRLSKNSGKANCSAKSILLSSNPLVYALDNKPNGTYWVLADRNIKFTCIKLGRSYIYNQDLLDKPVAELYLYILPASAEVACYNKFGTLISKI